MTVETTKKTLQECIPVGCLPSVALAVSEGGGLLPRVSVRGCLPRGCPPRGCLPEGGVCPVGTPVHPVDTMTDVCVNITFLQLLLRTVIRQDFIK